MQKIRSSKWAICCLILLMVISVGASVALASVYVANSNSGIFHYQGCQWEQKMSEYNRVYYNNRAACINDGYRPCKVCRP